MCYYLASLKRAEGKGGREGIGGGEVPRACVVFSPLPRIGKGIGSHKGEGAEKNWRKKRRGESVEKGEEGRERKEDERGEM